jgi:hypothetical protein
MDMSLGIGPNYMKKYRSEKYSDGVVVSYLWWVVNSHNISIGRFPCLLAYIPIGILEERRGKCCSFLRREERK